MMSKLPRKRKNALEGNGPQKKLKVDGEIKTDVTQQTKGLKKKKKKKIQLQSHHKKDISDSCKKKNGHDHDNGDVTKSETQPKSVSGSAEKLKKMKKMKNIVSTKVKRSHVTGELNRPQVNTNKKWKKRKPNNLKGEKDTKQNNKNKTKKKKIKEKVQLNIPKGPSDFDSNWKELIKTLEKPEPKKNRKPFIPRKKMKPETSEKPSKPESDIWFDDVDEILLGRPSMKTSSVVETGNKQNPLVKPESFSGLTKLIAMDCEMVGVGEDGTDSVLARASIVNQFGQCVYDKYVKPLEKVTDYRTFVSGIRPEHLEKGEEFSKVCKEISDLIKGRVLVGHAIHNDLKVLFLDHPHKKIRDTQRYKPFRALFQGRNPSLKKLSEKVLGVAVQQGQHDSIQDAQAAMRLYTMHRQAWEKWLREKGKPKTVPSAVAMDVSS